MREFPGRYSVQVDTEVWLEGDCRIIQDDKGWSRGDSPASIEIPAGCDGRLTFWRTDIPENQRTTTVKYQP